jgi:two-component system response regulator DesR
LPTLSEPTLSEPTLSEPTLSVIVIEDQAMIREALVSSLEAASLQVTASAETVREGALAIEKFAPDVIVTDYHLPDGVGTQLASMVRELGLPSRVLLLSGRGRPSIVDEAVSSGCHGFVSRSQPMRDLVEAIQAVGLGASVFPDGFLQQLAKGDKTAIGATLTDRERETLNLIASARTAEQIATDMRVSIHTVRNHIRSVLVKLHASSQLEAVIIAARSELIDILA